MMVFKDVDGWFMMVFKDVDGWFMMVFVSARKIGGDAAGLECFGFTTAVDAANFHPIATWRLSRSCRSNASKHAPNGDRVHRKELLGGSRWSWDYGWLYKYKYEPI